MALPPAKHHLHLLRSSLDLVESGRMLRTSYSFSRCVTEKTGNCNISAKRLTILSGNRGSDRVASVWCVSERVLTKQPAQFIEDGQVSLRLRTLITLSCPAVTAVYSAKNMTVLCAAWGCFSCTKEFFC